MYKILILVLCLSSMVLVRAQSVGPEVIATAGDHFSGNNVQLSWTIGEAVTETFATNALQLTQGFHQTNLTIVAVDNPVADFQVWVYPNPTTDRVNIETPDASTAFGLELTSANGRILLWQPATASMIRYLDLSGYAPGLYLLRLHTEDGKTIRSFKIIKFN